MGFITQPNKEGETKECDSCGMDLVGRLTDYKGRFPDKLQWQSATERKAHYDKDGNCKESTIPNEIELKSNEQSTLESEQNLSKGESKPEIISLATLDEKIKTMHGMCEAILHIVTDLKTKGVKIQA